jgi:hypothetical protein
LIFRQDAGSTFWRGKSAVLVEPVGTFLWLRASAISTQITDAIGSGAVDGKLSVTPSGVWLNDKG